MKVVLAAVLAVGAVLVAGVALLGMMASSADDDGKITLVLDKTELYKGQRTITYTITNLSKHTIGFGAHYDIQINRNGEWVSVEWMRDWVWIQILYVLEPGKSFSGVADLPEDVELGSYRLVKEVIFEDTGEKVVLTAEFMVLS